MGLFNKSIELKDLYERLSKEDLLRLERFLGVTRVAVDERNGLPIYVNMNESHRFDIMTFYPQYFYKKDVFSMDRIEKEYYEHAFYLDLTPVMDKTGLYKQARVQESNELKNKNNNNNEEFKDKTGIIILRGIGAPSSLRKIGMYNTKATFYIFKKKITNCNIQLSNGLILSILLDNQLIKNEVIKDCAIECINKSGRDIMVKATKYTKKGKDSINYYKIIKPDEIFYSYSTELDNLRLGMARICREDAERHAWARRTGKSYSEFDGDPLYGDIKHMEKPIVLYGSVETVETVPITELNEDTVCECLGIYYDDYKEMKKKRK